jgi:hypothetical protein
MFGPFRITNPLSGGLLWKIPWRLSKFQKRRHRERLRAVDGVVATIDAALAKQGQVLPAVERWKAEMPTEAEMLPKDKYTLFDRKAKRYRKGIHSMFLVGEERGMMMLGDWITDRLRRASQVDESFAKSQPPWFLSCAIGTFGCINLIDTRSTTKLGHAMGDGGVSAAAFTRTGATNYHVQHFIV